MTSHKKQHFIPTSYLGAWTDPECPADKDPFVWVFDADGTASRAKAPKNIFHETYMYTITGKNGERDLRLEHGLSGLESEFARLRRDKLAKHETLTDIEHLLVCLFIAAAHARTPGQREHWREQWQRPLKIMDDLAERMKTATEEQKRAMARMPTLSSKKDRGMSHEQVRQLVEEPLQALLFPQIRTMGPQLAKLDFMVLETDDDVGFITSDRPCVWCDPEGYKRPPLYRAPALMYPTIEITFPISPRQCIVLNRMGLAGYRKSLNALLVQHFNRRTRFWADDQFVVCKNKTDPVWFDPGEEPEDSWEKMHADEERRGDSAAEHLGRQERLRREWTGEDAEPQSKG